MISDADRQAIAAVSRFREEQVRVLLQRHVTFTDWCIRNLMQFWVSELEPEIIWTTEGELIGIGHGGRLMVPLRWLAHAKLTA